MTSIHQAVREARTDQEIYLLLTAYVRATRIGDEMSRLSEQMTSLPLAGPDDVRGRIQSLFVGLGMASRRLDDRSRTTIKEALYVFCEASMRLNGLHAVTAEEGLSFRAHNTAAPKSQDPQLAENPASLDSRSSPSRLEKEMILPDALSLIGEKEWNRRDFVVSVLASGFALSVQPVSAQTITTDGKGLTAGEVKIPTADGEMPAYRAMPATGGPFPVVLVVQEIFGVHEHIKDLCRRLAKAGYFAVAPELYARQGDVSQLKDIQEIFTTVVSKVPDAQVMGDLDATVEWASGTGKADTSHLAITGFCWGGRITWLYCAHNPRVKAGVAWYGRLVGQPSALMPKNPIDVAATLKVPVLGLYGAADQGIPVQSVDEMRVALAHGTSRSEVVVYPDTPHGFNADYRPSYRKEAAEDGWKRMLTWFNTHGAG